MLTRYVGVVSFVACAPFAIAAAFQEADPRESERIVVRSGSSVDVDAFLLEADADAPTTLQPRKKFFTAFSGREVFFRGVNVVYKDSPWYPDVTEFHPNLSFVEADVLYLKSLGINLVRLGVMWPGLMLQPTSASSPYNTTYAGKIREIVDMCAKHGIYTLLEPHQDEMNPKFCGEGAPNWYIDHGNFMADGSPDSKPFEVLDFPVPVQKTPFRTSPPSRKECLSHISFKYIWTNDAARAYQRLYEYGGDLSKADAPEDAFSEATSGRHFLERDDSAQEDQPRNFKGLFAEYWRTVGKLFAGVPGVLGGEMFNEPFPGDVFGQPEFRSNVFADKTNLQPLYENLTKAIRIGEKQEGSTHQMVLAFEPSWPVGNQDLNASAILPTKSGFTSAGIFVSLTS
eukprot:TRINITY_DN25728_c0_g1_i3.p1 TRINITY_DN25728_c0_g1~~TRINITY_DN25728_c0_g1_i3.p1  ORF type:complete len:399 (-),score=52.80 TRINITY_DN25728_c0_g1_i3:305-1501(-)